MQNAHTRYEYFSQRFHECVILFSPDVSGNRDLDRECFIRECMDSENEKKKPSLGEKKIITYFSRCPILCEQREKSRSEVKSEASL